MWYILGSLNCTTALLISLSIWKGPIYLGRFSFLAAPYLTRGVFYIPAYGASMCFLKIVLSLSDGLSFSVCIQSGTMELVWLLRPATNCPGRKRVSALHENRKAVEKA